MAARLDALRDNLSHIGYFNRTSWNELDVCRDSYRVEVHFLEGQIRHGVTDQLPPAAAVNVLISHSLHYLVCILFSM